MNIPDDGKFWYWIRRALMTTDSGSGGALEPERLAEAFGLDSDGRANAIAYITAALAQERIDRLVLDRELRAEDVLLEQRIAELESTVNATPPPDPLPTDPEPTNPDVEIFIAGRAPTSVNSVNTTGVHALRDNSIRQSGTAGWEQFEVLVADGPVPGPGGRRAEEFIFNDVWSPTEASCLLEVMFPTDWNIFSDSDSWAIHWQYAETGSPHISVLSYPSVTAGKVQIRWRLEDGASNFKDLWVGDVDEETELKLGMEVRWSQGSDGLFKPSINGVACTGANGTAHALLVNGVYSGPTYSEASTTYPKWGAYCGGGASRRIWIRRFMWAPGLARVAELILVPEA